MSLRNFLRRHVIADDPTPELSTLDRLDLERSMADHPAGSKRLTVVRTLADGGYPPLYVARPEPESLEEALADDDLFAVARGASVVREAQPESTAKALLHYEVTGDAAAAMGIFRAGAVA